VPSAALPRGTVTFLFTDIEGSTRLWAQYPQAMGAAVARHEALLRDVITEAGGVVFKTVGDALYTAFASALDGVTAALEGQRVLLAEVWGATGPLRVRMALHTGVVEARDGDYLGLPLSRVARILAAAHGGQVLLSHVTQELACDQLPPGVELSDLGAHRLNDLDLSEQIFQLAAPDLPTSFPLLKTLDPRRGNLPVQPTPLIGREREITAVSALLRWADVRLLTLSGPGGIGKTRLALQVATDLLDDYPNGVFFVDLAPVTDPDLVTSAIAQPLGVRAQGSRPLIDSLKDYLLTRRLLLVLDNFEHVVVAAPVVSTLLAGAPELKALVTSRVALQLSGEREYHVPPLPVPIAPAISFGAVAGRTSPSALPQPTEYVRAIAENPSVRLFVERATAVRPDFALTTEHCDIVAEICRRLDGLPLAIELVAARCRLLMPDALLARLGSRLALGVGGPRDAPARQQTLDAAIAWSYDLLDVADQRLFARMAIFVGGCTLEAVEAICGVDGDPPDLLAGVERLLAQSLLYTAASQADAAPRVKMLETIREYAFAKLLEHGEAERLGERHARFFCEMAAHAESKQHRAEQVAWLDWTERELGNVRAALSWSTSIEDPGSPVNLRPRTEVGMRLAEALEYFWLLRGYLIEGRNWLERLLARDTAALPVIRSEALTVAGHLAVFCGDQQRAAQCFDESVSLARHAGDQTALARATQLFSAIYRFRGDYARSAALLEESIALAQQLGDDRGVGEGFAVLASCTCEQGAFDRTDTLLQQSLAIFRRIGLTLGIEYAQMVQGKSACCQGDLPRAATLLRESIAISHQSGNKTWRARSLNYLGLVVYHQGDMHDATAILQEAHGLAQEIGSGRELVETLYGLGRVALREGAVERAVSLLSESLILARDQGMRLFVAERLEACGAAAIALSQASHAVRLFGAAETLREAIGAPLPPVERADYERDLAGAHSQLDEAAFATAWAAGQALTLEQAIAYALEGPDAATATARIGHPLGRAKPGLQDRHKY
jgi:predicted ATPase/class 3 adenylate cyclase